MKRLKSTFLDKVIAVARRYCGDDFLKKFNEILKEREENLALDLKEAKAKVEVEPEVQEEIIAEIKFDTLFQDRQGLAYNYLQAFGQAQCFYQIL